MSSKHDKHAEAVIKRVSRKHEDDGHGGGWKVAFADFCLALMCLFMLLWVLSARDSERASQALAAGSTIEEGAGPQFGESMRSADGSLISREPVPATATGPAGDSAEPRPEKVEPVKRRYDTAAEQEDLSQLLKQLSAESGLAGNLMTDITPQGLRVMLHDTERRGMFKLGSAVPSERFSELLRRMGPLFAQIENQMLIVGHTDALQYASAGTSGQSNWSLSSNRAMVARAHLLAGGMPTQSVLQVVGMAERAPIDAVRPTAAVNRRIELLIMTTSQARATAAMFGVPGEVKPLTEGVDTALPEREALRDLRHRLSEGGPAAAGR
ncbi:OmpA family protein [Aquabacterium sp. A7-Y]|uniref:flagellar motor protein MotB n=1 Tax=Aquabacterium sp. A7-Y TaxID=1349605 RepID=UPI00223CFFC2|nr:flagellar motor protein MotB [Aquabacterium sp. A7-Y]MCW7536530.1 OmpA family protein [Aquabacterium sp. A7-Y]